MVSVALLLIAVTRIFSSLAVFALLVLAGNLLLGLSIGPFNDLAQELREVQRDADRRQLLGAAADDPHVRSALQRRDELVAQVQPLRQRTAIHKLLGIAAALVALLVNSVAVTYFVGTSRWCKEVSDTYGLDMRRVELCRRLKRRTFASALISMLTVVILAGLGAAADPGNSLSGGAKWVTLHLNTALLGMALIGGLFWYQIGKVRANYELIQAIMDDVRRIRGERGLDPLPAASSPA